MLSQELREKCVNTIRFLAADTVQKANSGHPGMPMGSADVAFVLWNRFLKYNPEDPKWPNRDRFVLSSGHASALLYSLLHLSGYKLTLDDLKQFRQWDSITPGHPEYGLTEGVECTTGPLGAGFGNAVGMALAGKMMSSRFNTEKSTIINPFIYSLCGDGDIQEGVASEAASFAGHLGLGNLVVIYDSNDITIAGSTNLSMSEDVAKRFEAYNWHVQTCDGHNHDEIESCLNEAKSLYLKPSLIIAKTTIAKGAPTKAGSNSAHGSPLGDEELNNAKKKANWSTESFYVPVDVQKIFDEKKAQNIVEYIKWHKDFDAYKTENPKKADVWEKQLSNFVPENIFEEFEKVVFEQEAATRKLSGMIIQKAAEIIPGLVGGSADLEPSNKTFISESKAILKASVNSLDKPDSSFEGKNIHYGIREHAMGSIVNGLYLFGGLKPFCGTFSVFSDYMKTSLRLAALSEVPSIFVYTHDSFWVGEDGPTHQPIEHTWSLRLIPELNVWRPADGLETAAAWAHSLDCSQTTKPSAILLTRQGVKTLSRVDNFNKKDIFKGGYVVLDSENSKPDITLLSTGSECGLAEEAAKLLKAKNFNVRFVSMPCVELFEEQSEDYKAKVLPSDSKIIAIEAANTAPWYKYADYVIGKDTFGASAPGNILADKFGFTVEKVTANILNWLG